MGGVFTKKRNNNGEGGIARGYKWRTINGERKFEPREVVERVLGSVLPASIIVHHVDGNTLNNDHENLVVCQDAAYHRLIHMREKALNACGNANWHPCRYCKIWDAPENMKENKASFIFYHSICRNADRRAKWKQQRT